MPFHLAVAYVVALSTAAALIWAGVRNRRADYHRHSPNTLLDTLLAHVQARAELAQEKLEHQRPPVPAPDIAGQLGALHTALNVNAGVNPEFKPASARETPDVTVR
jgi:hypothetical protein